MKSRVVSWIGVVMSIVQLLVKEVQRLGGGDDEIHYLSTPEGEDLVKEFAQRLMERQRTWSRAVKEAYCLAGMEKEYNDFIQQFEVQEESGRLVAPMIKGLNLEKIVQAYQKAVVVLETYGVNLQEVVDPEKEQRDPSRGSYIASVKDIVEADEENKNQSAVQRREQNCQDNTLLERLFFGLVYFLYTGKHLDVLFWTLCTGSRRRTGRVPGVDFNPACGRVCVDWYYPANHDDALRARSVVSSPPKPREAVA